jgi:hypothetical protein
LCTTEGDCKLNDNVIPIRPASRRPSRRRPEIPPAIETMPDLLEATAPMLRLVPAPATPKDRPTSGA